MNNPDLIHPLMLMSFGQFVDHDMSRTAISMIAASSAGLILSLLFNFHRTDCVSP